VWPKRRLRRSAALAAGAAASLGLGACSHAQPGSVRPAASTTVPIVRALPGATVSFAEQPGASPNWIFPFTSLVWYWFANVQQFQYLMYRPLYWFESPTTTAPVFEANNSLADPPSWNRTRTVVTIRLKGWKFADGQRVDARSVVFWLDMLKAEKTFWAGYVPGYFPDNVAAYGASSPTGLTVTLHLTGPVNTTWFLDNELSQIVPMTEAWDVTSPSAAPGSGGCGRVTGGLTTGAGTAAACRRVWRFDTDDNGRARHPMMAADRATYATNRLWQEGVDGPWRLMSYDSGTGAATFGPNPRYGGPQRPYMSELSAVPFTSFAQELAVLSRRGPAAPQVGYGSLGPFHVDFAGYRRALAWPWATSYDLVNFNATTDRYLLRQLYIRQALQLLVDQAAIIRRFDHGDAVAGYGPVPSRPESPYLSPTLRTDPYRYDPSRAMALLRQHGWRIVPGGPDTCVRPGTGAHHCGAHIREGTPLRLDGAFMVPQGILATRLEANDWARAGIVVRPGPPFDSLFGVGACTPSMPQCGWTLGADGWSYYPDYEPSGEDQFATSSISNQGNVGSYSDPRNDRLIRASTTEQGTHALFAWEDYLARQLPVIWQPVAASVVEISRRLAGVTAANASFAFMPEYWYFPADKA
jgi:peptide/nickel transport system substrate-binding protein